VWDDLELYPGEEAEKETGIENTVISVTANDEGCNLRASDGQERPPHYLTRLNVSLITEMGMLSTEYGGLRFVVYFCTITCLCMKVFMT